MRGHDFRLLSCACCGWGAAAIVLGLDGGARGFGILAGLAGVGTVAGLWWRRAVAGPVLALCSVGILLLSVTSAGHLYREQAGPVTAWTRSGAAVSGHLVVTKEPVRVTSTKADRRPVVLVPARLRQVTARGVSADVDTPVLVVGGEAWKEVGWRSEALVTGRLRPVDGPGPARAMITARGGPQQVSPPGFPLSFFESLRGSLRESFARTPQEPRGLTPALVDGDVSGLPDDLKETMNTVGMSHLNAVSGSNVTIVLVAALWACGWLSLRRRARLGAGLLCLIAFVMLCHPDPSVIRAAAMGVVGLLGTSVGRPRAACPALGAAVLGLLAWDPWLALSPGFALSALATLGLVLFARPWTEAVSRALPPWCAKPVELCMIPIAAQAPCLPVLVALSGTVSPVSIPANVLAEPFVAPATLGGMVVLLLTPLPLGIREVVAWPVAMPAWGIALIARTAAAAPGASVPWPSGAVGIVLAVLVVLVPLFTWPLLRFIGRWGIVTGGVAGLVSLAVLWPTPGEHAVRTGWLMGACDVGQGDGSVISTGTPGHAVAVDVGPEESDGMTRCLDRHGVTTLDAVVLSHFHADHVGALPKVLDAVPVGDVFVTPVREEASGGGHGERGAAPLVDGTLRRHGKPAIALSPGQVVNIGVLHIEVLWPKRVIHEGSVQNNASLVLDVTSPQGHLLFLGDAEKEADAAIRADVERRAARRPYDVVKVGHHGSGNQSPALYTAARATFGTISVGADNDYGHPSAKLLRMLESAHTRACRTDRQGDVTFAPSTEGLTPSSQRSSCG